VNRRALLLALATSACRGAASPPLAFARAALRVARNAGAQFAEPECLAELSRIRALAALELKPAAHASLGVVLSELLFGRLGFVREVTDPDLRFVLLPSVLRERRGSCVGLGSLFLALAEGQSPPAHGVLMPGHFYVRVQEQGAKRNVELLRRGEAMPDTWYDGRFPIPGGAAREYARPLTAEEVAGVIEYNVGNERRRQLRLEEARQAYLRATLHVLGRLDEAAKSYRLARSVNPRLPGVDWNITVLEEERSVSR